MARENPRVPIVMGDFTNWKPKPFFDIVDYCEALHPQYEQAAIISRMHLDKVLSYRKTDPEKFDEDELVHFRRYTRIFYEEMVPEKWKQVLQRSLLYKKPHLAFAVNTR